MHSVHVTDRDVRMESKNYRFVNGENCASLSEYLGTKIVTGALKAKKYVPHEKIYMTVMSLVLKRTFSPALYAIHKTAKNEEKT